jgi:hypothetical protein
MRSLGRTLPLVRFLPFILAVACSDPTAPSPFETGVESGALRSLAADPHPSQLAIARAIPGFGGYFLDEAGRPTAFLTDTSRRSMAARALAGFLADRRFAPSELRIVRGRYGYDQLDHWYRVLRGPAFSTAGVILGDVDEGHDRIRLGVPDPLSIAKVSALLTALAIPTDAVALEVHPAFTTMATLRDRVRPLGGGLQINFFATPPFQPGPSLICTLGFNADHDGVRSFITNSHCTNVEGGTALATDYYQNLRSDGSPDFIGTEVDDPEWQLAGSADCPLPFQCRYSDAARVAYAPGAPVAFGQIARIDALTTSTADTVHDITGTFTIGAERPDPVLGEIVNKVGRTTGWTQGPVTATCMDVLAAGTTHIRLCQSTVSALVGSGDSGSPVFAGADASSVTLLGILWGGNTGTGPSEFVFSPMSGIARELGQLTTH